MARNGAWDGLGGVRGGAKKGILEGRSYGKERRGGGEEWKGRSDNGNER